MREKMLKAVSKVFALCIALAIFVCNASIVSAASCPGSADGMHRYTVRTKLGEYDDHLTHAHFTGEYDEYGEEKYKTCAVTMHYERYATLCMYCGEEEPGSRWSQLISTTHSID